MFLLGLQKLAKYYPECDLVCEMSLVVERPKREK